MSKAKLTYRFEQRMQPERPEPSPSETPHENIIPLFREDFHAGPDISVSRTARETEADRIERLIRSSDSLRHGAGEGSDEPDAGDDSGGTDRHGLAAHDGILVAEEAEQPGYVTYRRLQTRKKKDGLTLVLSGIGAILTGILIGSFIFSFFRGSADLPAASPAAAPGAYGGAANGELPEQLPDFRETGPLAENGTPAAGTAGTASVVHHLPEQVYYVVQNGVFRSKEGADTASDQLRDKGLAGAVEEGAVLAVYAGMAKDRDDALLIAQQLQAEQLELFIKPYELPEFSLTQDTDAATAALLACLADGRALADLMLDISLQHIGKTTPGAIPDGHWQAVKAAHQQWTETASRVPDLAEDRLASASQAMNRAMAEGMAALEQYAKSPSEAYLWHVQSALLEVVIAQKQVLELLAAKSGTVMPNGHPA